MTIKNEKNIDDIGVARGSGNVFEDMGLVNSKECLTKAMLVSSINNAIDELDATQAEIATLLGIQQPQVSYLQNGRLTGFTIERLLKYLNLLNRDVEINIKVRPAHSRQPANTTVRLVG